MLFPLESAIKADAKTVAASGDYDIVIVGSGISGAIIAKQAAEAGKRVLILEAGTGANSTLAGYDDLLTTFYSAARPRISNTAFAPRTAGSCGYATTPTRS